jgi:hypothetical protein
VAHGLITGLPEIGQGFFPHLTSEGVEGKSLNLVTQTISHHPFDSLDDPGVQRTTLLP